MPGQGVVMDHLRIAAVVCRCPFGDIEGNLEKMEHWLAAAKRAGAHLVCFPEMNITGYSTRSAVRKVAEAADRSTGDRLRAMALHYDAAILAGLVEIDADGALYITHLVALPGEKTGRYRKLHLSPPEQALYAAGGEVPLFQYRRVRFGLQLCYDAHFPELSTRMAVMGADAVFMPHASPHGTSGEKHRSWSRHLPARAYDNGIFVVACNQCGDNDTGLTFPGTAMVLGPQGEVIARNDADGEALVVADLDGATLKAVRTHRMRYFLPHRRPELYGCVGKD
jgi:N-carbamoylputrescine amidase